MKSTSAGTGSHHCTNSEMLARLVALEAGLVAFKDLMTERDKRYEQRSKGQDDAVSAALVAAKEATIVAKTEVDSHLKSLNEIRTMSLDQARNFAVAKVVDTKFEGVEAQLQGIRDTISLQTGKGTGVREVWSYIIAIAAIVMAGTVGYFRH